MDKQYDIAVAPGEAAIVNGVWIRNIDSEQTLYIEKEEQKKDHQNYRDISGLFGAHIQSVNYDIQDHKFTITLQRPGEIISVGDGIDEAVIINAGPLIIIRNIDAKDLEILPSESQSDEHGCNDDEVSTD